MESMICSKMHAFMANAEADIPGSLQTFLNTLIETHKRGKGEMYEKKFKE